MSDELIDEATVTQHTWTMRHQTDEHIAFIEQLYKMCKNMKDKMTSMNNDIADIKKQLDDEKEQRHAAEQKTAVTEQALKDKQQEMETRVHELDKRNTENTQMYEQKLDVQRQEHENKVHEMEGKIQTTISECDRRVKLTEDECQQKCDQLTQNINSLNTQVQNLTESCAEKERLMQKMGDDKDAEIRDLRRQVMASESTVKGVMFMRQNVDAFHLATAAIVEPVAACMLPDGCILVADTMAGILLFSPHTELLQRLQSDQWKWPQGIVYDSVNRRLYIVCMQKQSDGAYRRVVMTIHLEPDELKLYHRLREGESMFGPPEADVDTHVAKEKLARATNGDLYLSLADNLGSALYKYSQQAGWNLLTKRNGATFTDLAVLSVSGPITEVLVVESRMGYVHKLSVRGKDVASRSSIAIVEKPSCIAVDQLGQLFCQDIISGKVHGVNSRFEVARDVCLIDDSVFSITASHGYLGVALREHKTVRIYRYDTSEVPEIPELYAMST